MRYLVALLLLVGIHFSLSGLMLPEGAASFLAPITQGSRPLVGSAGSATHLLGALSVLGLGMGLLALFGWLVPGNLWLPAVCLGVVASVVLYVWFLSAWAILPLALDALILWGIFASNWTAAGLRG